MLRAIARQGEDGAELDAILAYCNDAGFEISRHGLRGQMWNYVNRELLVRLREGVFRITPAGAKAAGIEPPAGIKRRPARSERGVLMYVAHYNFCRVHETLRVTPAMQLGVTDHIWTIGELVGAALEGVLPAPGRRRYGRFTVIDGAGDKAGDTNMRH